MKKVLRVVAFVLLAALLLIAAVPETRLIAKGMLLGQACYRGRPTAYWAYALRQHRGEDYLSVSEWQDLPVPGAHAAVFMNQPSRMDIVLGFIGKLFGVDLNASPAVLSGGARALPVLAELLDDEDPDVVFTALCHLRQDDPDLRSFLPPLQRLLRHRVRWIRVYAVDVLSGIGPEVSPMLVAILADADYVVRSETARVLLALGSQPDELIPVLVETAKRGCGLPSRERDDLHFRKEAADRLLELNRTDFAVAAYVGILRSSRSGSGYDSDVVEVLGRIGPKARAAIPILLEATADEDEFRREAAEDTVLKIVPEARRPRRAWEPLP